MNYPSEGNGDPDRIEHLKVFKFPILEKPNREYSVINDHFHQEI